MAKLTDLNTDLFGAIGVTDPEVLKTGIAIRRSVNFKESPIVDDFNYEFLPIPAGFVMTSVYLKETEKCAAGNITLKTREDPTQTLGTTFAVGSSDLHEAFMSPSAGETNSPVAFLAGDMLCIKASADMAAGAVDIVIHGYLMDGGSLNANSLAVPYRQGQSDADFEANKSSGDLYLKKVAAGA